MILFASTGRVNGRVAWRPATRLERARARHDHPLSTLSHMSTTMRPGVPSAPAQRAPFGPWVSVVLSAAMLATVGSTLGGIVLFGLFYAKATGWPGPFTLWQYLSLRDIGEELLLSVVMVYAYRSRPTVYRAVRAQGGVVRVTLIFGTLLLVATRLIFGAGFHRPGLLAMSWMLWVGCIAYPIVWTVARRAPDAEPPGSTDRLTDREFFNTSFGLFLVVGSLHFMHWVTYEDAAGLLNFFALFVIPAAAVVLGIGARHVIAGACKALEENPPDWAITILAIMIGWAAVFYYFLFAHPRHSP